MKPASILDRPTPGSPRVLVVDDDRRVRELLEIAFSAHGFRVLTAGEGEEAIQLTYSDHPDLLVLDVRLPKKSGIEVCETLRRHPEDDQVPIILVSAAAETDARLQGLAAGADDYLTKPFSPKELIARSRRLLARTAEGREARRRAVDLERELRHAQEDAQRAHTEVRREQRLRDLAVGLGRDLHRVLDLDELARRLLFETQSRLGVELVAVLLPESPRGPLVPYAARGDGLDRFAGIAIERGGPLASLLRGLGRPVVRRELERLPELRAEMSALISAGVALLAPLEGAIELEGLLLADERRDGTELARADLEVLGGLCDVGAAAIRNAQDFRAQVDRQMELLAAMASSETPGGPARIEAAALVDRAARATLLPSRERELLAHAVALGPWAFSVEGRGTVDHLAVGDPTGRLGDLSRLCSLAARQELPGGERFELERAAALLGVALGVAAERQAGAPLDRSLERVLSQAPIALDPATRQALEASARERSWLENNAA